MVDGEHAEQHSNGRPSKTPGRRLLLGLGVFAILLVANGCAAGKGTGQEWTFGPTLAPSSRGPSAGASVAPSESAVPAPSPAAP
jgi:hypothetical protein